METETEIQTPEAERAAAEAAFTASTNDQPVEDIKTEPVKAEPVETLPPPEVKAEEAAPPAPSPVTLTAEEYAELRAMPQKVNEFQSELRKAHGRIGALNDQLLQTMKAKEAEGKPAVLTAPELTRLKGQFPELGEMLGPDLAEWFASQTSKQDPTAVQALVEQEIAKAREAMDKRNLEERMEALEEEHPDAPQVIRSPEFAAWRLTLTADQQASLDRATSPYVVAKKLTAFKEWRDTEAKAKQQSKKRLEAAVTPTGTSRSGQHVLSDREEAEKAFAEAIKS